MRRGKILGKRISLIYDDFLNKLSKMYNMNLEKKITKILI
jgi:hypothetical protein